MFAVMRQVVNIFMLLNEIFVEIPHEKSKNLEKKGENNR